MNVRDGKCFESKKCAAHICALHVFYSPSFLFKIGLVHKLMISGITMMNHAIGSDMIMPQYPIAGAKINATTTLVISSKELEKTGVLLFPNPCIAFLDKEMTAGTK